MAIWVYAVLLAGGVVLLVVTAGRVVVGGLEGRIDPAASYGVDDTEAGRILAERYASGEMTEQEYRHRLQILDEGR